VVKNLVVLAWKPARPRRKSFCWASSVRGPLVRRDAARDETWPTRPGPRPGVGGHPMTPGRSIVVWSPRQLLPPVRRDGNTSPSMPTRDFPILTAGPRSAGGAFRRRRWTGRRYHRRLAAGPSPTGRPRHRGRCSWNGQAVGADFAVATTRTRTRPPGTVSMEHGRELSGRLAAFDNTHRAGSTTFTPRYQWGPTAW